MAAEHTNEFTPESNRKSKRSRIIKLCLLATVTGIACAYTLSGNDTEREVPQDFADEQECVQKTGNGEMCKSAIAGAQEDHLINAPKFSDLKTCEREFGAGNCATPTAPTQPASQEANSTGGIFMPMMAGFLLSRLVSNAGGYSFGSIYRTPNGDMYSGRCDNNTKCDRNSSNYVGTRGSGGTVYSGNFVNGWMRGNTAAPSMSKTGSGGYTRSATISRGGFGSSFHGYSGG